MPIIDCIAFSKHYAILIFKTLNTLCRKSGSIVVSESALSVTLSLMRSMLLQTINNLNACNLDIAIVNAYSTKEKDSSFDGLSTEETIDYAYSLTTQEFSMLNFNLRCAVLQPPANELISIVSDVTHLIKL